MRILIKGAGDLATGIAYRLKTCGYDILMTETAIPTTVRRTVAFSRCVYEGTAKIEAYEAVLVKKPEQIEAVLEQDKIPVIIDEGAEIKSYFKPDIVVDAIIAKRNIGTSIDDAELVIGVGPGFTAGTDCHCVVETKRGHFLGKVIYEGSAIPNTGVPGMINGYAAERIIRANAEGDFVPLKEIGDTVDKGDVVATSGGVDIVALMPGVIRGMLQEGVHVVPGMKCGDIDARCELEYCYTISDKARAIGGGVLEAIERYYYRKNNIGVVLLAAGRSERFGSNKLLENIGGERLFTKAVDAVKKLECSKTIVSGYEEVFEYAKEQGFKCVLNDKPEEGISKSVILGLDTLRDKKAVIFAVSDQPGVTENTFRRLISAYAHGNRELAAMGSSKESIGNPCIFGKKYYSELFELTGDKGGKRVIMKHLDDLTIIPADESELIDIDYRDDIGRMS